MNDTNTELSSDQEAIDTAMNYNLYNDEVKNLFDEIQRLNTLIKTAKTQLKRDMYKKKLEKVKGKTYKALLGAAMQNPALLKKTEEETTEA